MLAKIRTSQPIPLVDLTAPDDVSLLTLLATQIEDHFFSTESEELNPRMTWVQKTPKGNVATMILVDEVTSGAVVKETYGALFKRLLTESETIGVLLSSEAWMLTLHPEDCDGDSIPIPSQSPMRTEVLSLIVGLPGQTMMRVTPFMRPEKCSVPQRTAATQVTWSTDPGTNFKGRLLGTDVSKDDLKNWRHNE
jgi:hypothetical protein